MESIRDIYFRWLCEFIYDFDSADSQYSYKILLEQLFNTPFRWIMPMDENRAGDGMALRDRFSLEYVGNYNSIVLPCADAPCSVLEMMVALALRCEESFMYDKVYGDRTGEWFWGMIVSLGLNIFTDEQFSDMDTYYDVVYILDNFMSRYYNPNGKGGLFTVECTDVDMREEEIWKQLHIYLHELNEKGA